MHIYKIYIKYSEYVITTIYHYNNISLYCYNNILLYITYITMTYHYIFTITYCYNNILYMCMRTPSNLIKFKLINLFMCSRTLLI